MRVQIVHYKFTAELDTMQAIFCEVWKGLQQWLSLPGQTWAVTCASDLNDKATISTAHQHRKVLHVQLVLNVASRSYSEVSKFSQWHGLHHQTQLTCYDGQHLYTYLSSKLVHWQIVRCCLSFKLTGSKRWGQNCLIASITCYLSLLTDIFKSHSHQQPCNTKR